MKAVMYGEESVYLGGYERVMYRTGIPDELYPDIEWIDPDYISHQLAYRPVNVKPTKNPKACRAPWNELSDSICDF